MSTLTLETHEELEDYGIGTRSVQVMMQTTQLRAIKPSSQAIILARKADKLALSSEPLRPARAIPQIV